MVGTSGVVRGMGVGYSAFLVRVTLLRLIPLRGTQPRSGPCGRPSSRTGTQIHLTIFWISKISRFPSKSAVCGVAALLMTPFIPNIHGVIMIFRGFFRADPFPLRFFAEIWQKSCSYCPYPNSDFRHLCYNGKHETRISRIRGRAPITNWETDIKGLGAWVWRLGQNFEDEDENEDDWEVYPGKSDLIRPKKL